MYRVIGTQELIIIFAAILLLFGASKMPEFARSMGRSMGEFKKAKEESEHELLKLTGDMKKQLKE